MKKLSCLLIIFLSGLLTAACNATANPVELATPSDVPTSIATPTLAAGDETPVTAEPTSAASPTVAPVEPTAVSVEPSPETNTSDLLTLVTAELPADAYERLHVLPLYTPEGERPLWAVYSVGYLNHNLDPLPGHFVALYTQENGRWQEVARHSLNNDPAGSEGVFGYGPEIILEESVNQVDLAPGDTGNLWLVIEGGIGAHGGLFQLLRFDGTNLYLEMVAGNSSPGVGYLEDLNNDARPELILRQHDYYVFCYACGVRYLNFGIHSWDNAARQLVDHTLQPLPPALQDNPAYQPNNRAVELANAGLWLDALAHIEAAERAAAETAVPSDADILAWNAVIIRHYNQAYQAELNHAPYPLLTNIFYGDYAAALDLMRSYSSEQLFSTVPPIIQGTMAEGNEQWLAEYILQETNAAITARPDLAAAYFFRAWATYLNNPANPQVTADLQQAATLSPNEPLFTQVDQPAANRIQFGTGETAALVEGQLQPQTVDVYVIAAQAGQQMTVMLTARDDKARITVQDSAGDYLYGQTSTTLWQGELRQTDDYVIRVFAEETAVDYTLQVIIPQRISFAPGAFSATVEGSVAAYVSDDYILGAQAGQMMTVNIDSPNDNVLLTLVGADGIPLTNGLMSGATAWQGELLVTQDYTIRAIGTDAAASYTLTVTIE